MTVVTDVVAKLRADTSDFTRGMKVAESAVRNLERSASSVSTTTGRMGGSVAYTAGSLRTSFQSAASSASTAAMNMASSSASIARSFESASSSVAGMGASVSRLRDERGRFVSASAEISQAADGIGKSMGQTASSVLGSVGGMKMGIAGLAAGAAAAAVAVGAAFAKITLSGIQAAASYEQTTIAFTAAFKAMGRTADDAETYLTNLRDFAAKTPFTLTGLLDSVRGLIAVGNSPEKVITQMLPAIGDMASMMGVGEQAIAGVVYAMRQMTGSPRVLAQDLYQVQNALPGFNAKMALAKDSVLALAGGFKQGDMAGLTKAMESGVISGKQAVDALIRGMAAFPGAAGMMKAQSETLNGVMSTFKDNVNNALIDGFKPAIPMISKALLGLMPVVENFTKGFANAMGPQVSKAISTVVPALVKMSAQAGPALGAFIETVMPLLTPLVELLGRLGFAAGGIVLTALRTLGPLFSTIANAVNGILDALTPVIGALVNLGTELGKSTGFWQDMITEVKLLIQVLAPWIAIMVQGVAVLVRFANKLFGLIRPFTQVAVASGGLRKILAGNTQAMITVMTKLGYAFGFVASLAKQIFAKISSAAQAGAKAFVGFWNENISRWINVFVDAGKRVLSFLGGLVGNLYRAAIRMASGLVGGLIDGIDKIMPGFMKDLIGWTQDAISKAASDARKTAWEAGYAVGTNFGNAIVSGTKDAMKNLPGGVAYLGGYGPGGTQGPKGTKKPPKGQTDTTYSTPTTDTSNTAKTAPALKEAFKSVSYFLKAVHDLVGKAKVPMEQWQNILKRSPGIWTELGLTTKARIAQFKKDFAALFANGILSKAEFAKLKKSIGEIASAIASATSSAQKQFGKFKDMILKAFDAATEAGVQKIRDKYAGLSGAVMGTAPKSTLPDFGAVFDVGSSALSSSLEDSISTMRDSLSGALNGLFGNGSPMDMSLKGIQKRFNAAMKSIEAARSTAITAAGAARQTAYQAAQTQHEALTPAEQALKDLQDQSNVENLQRNRMEAEQALADAQKIRNTRLRNAAIAEAQQRLNDALRAIQIDALQKQAEEERKQRDKEYQDAVDDADKKYNAAVEEADRLYQIAVDAAQDRYDLEVATNDKLTAEAIKNYEYERDQDRTRLEEALDRLQTMLDKKIIKWADFKKRFQALLDDPVFASAIKDSGVNLGKNFGAGLASTQKGIIAIVDAILKKISERLELHSPAKKGPLSTLDHWWDGFGKTLTSGVDPVKVSAGMSRKIIGGGPTGVKIPNSQYGGIGFEPWIKPSPRDGGVTIQVTVQGSVTAERDLAETIRQELIKTGRRDGSIFGSIV